MVALLYKIFNSESVFCDYNGQIPDMNDTASIRHLVFVSVFSIIIIVYRMNKSKIKNELVNKLSEFFVVIKNDFLS